MSPDMEWRAIEAAAYAQVSAEIETAIQTPLVFGDFIAWAEYRFARTDALSPLHRVGSPMGAKAYTTCHEAIPAPANWLVLTPGFAHALQPCRFCEAEYQRFSRGNAA